VEDRVSFRDREKEVKISPRRVAPPAQRGAPGPISQEPVTEIPEAAELIRPQRRPWTKEERDLLRDWAARARAGQHAHYFLMTRLRRRNLALGVPVVVFTAVVGTSLFATLANAGDRVPLGLRIPVAVASVAASVLAAVQTFLKFQERAERHGLAADWLSAIHREIEQVLLARDDEIPTPQAILGRFRKEINKVVQNYPEVGERTWHRFAVQYGAKEPLER
jgi:hypothetical protein